MIQMPLLNPRDSALIEIPFNKYCHVHTTQSYHRNVDRKPDALPVHETFALFVFLLCFSCTSSQLCSLFEVISSVLPAVFSCFFIHVSVYSEYIRVIVTGFFLLSRRPCILTLRDVRTKYKNQFAIIVECLGLKQQGCQI